MPFRVFDTYNYYINNLDQATDITAKLGTTGLLFLVLGVWF